MLNQASLTDDSTLYSFPLKELRQGYLWVSDLMSQAWCEKQLQYKIKMPEKVKKPAAVQNGSIIHLARGKYPDHVLATRVFVRLAESSPYELNVLFSVREGY